MWIGDEWNHFVLNLQRKMLNGSKSLTWVALKVPHYQIKPKIKQLGPSKCTQQKVYIRFWLDLNVSADWTTNDEQLRVQPRKNHYMNFLTETTVTCKLWNDIPQRYLRSTIILELIYKGKVNCILMNKY